MGRSGEPVSPGVSLRAVLIGLILCLAIAVGEPYGVLVLRASPMAADYSTGAALFLFFVLTLLINPLARVLSGSRLRRGELGTVYIMMVVSAAIPSWGFSMNLIPLLGGVFYYATPENKWVDLIHTHVPSWLVPDDRSAIWKLFEGGARGEPIPWGTWVEPLLAWSCYIVTLYFVTLCLLVILRKQWMERERILFPLAILPLEMSATEDDRIIPKFFRNYLTWIGFSIPAIISSVNALHHYYNFIPIIDLNLNISILRHSISLHLTPHFEVVGLSYLLSLDVAFGIWFFAFLNLIMMGAMRLVGWSIGPGQPYSYPAPPTLANLALGALLFLVISMIWTGRAHLKDVLRKAFIGDAEIDDSGELLSYRVAVLGALSGFFLCVFWLYLAGMNLLSALVFLLSALIIFIGLARIISQTGLAYFRASVPAPVVTVNVLGTPLIGASGLTAMALSFPWCADVRTFVMASAATGLKVAEVTRLEFRRLFWAIVAAILITLVGSAWAIIDLAYTYGGINLTSWQFGAMTPYTIDWVTRNVTNPEPARLWHLAFAGVGSVLMGIMTYIKARFVSFPIHPIGMALGLGHPLPSIWFSVLIAWVLKAVILKYGGVRLYTSLRPFFLGMPLGAFATAGVWMVIDFFTGMSGNFVITIR